MPGYKIAEELIEKKKLLIENVDSLLLYDILGELRKQTTILLRIQRDSQPDRMKLRVGSRRSPGAVSLVEVKNEAPK